MPKRQRQRILDVGARTAKGGRASRRLGRPHRTRLPQFVHAVRAGITRTRVIITAAATAIGLLIAIPSIQPRILVEPGEALNPTDAFSTPFIVTNDGQLALRDVSLRCNLRKVEAGGSQSGVENLSTATADPPTRQILPGERETYICFFPFQFPSPITDADISVTVRFRSQWLPGRYERRFRFVTLPRSDDKLQWSPRPMASER